MKVFINTTSTGANIVEDIVEFPTVVQLIGEPSAFFKESIGDGTDIRVTKSDGITKLPFDLESWDPSKQEAVIWVLFDTIYGNNSSQYITYCPFRSMDQTLIRKPAV